MKLCVYCGTFNPIHKVHLAIASYVKKTFDFDMILFIPAYKPPHKNIDDELANHRYNMVRMAIQGNSAFSISNIEFRNNRYSYTINTIEELYKMYTNIEGKIRFIIGTDAFENLENWYEIDKLKKLVQFLVFPRKENFNPDFYNRYKEEGYDFICVNMPYINVSSSIIRSRVKKGKSIQKLVPDEILHYIEKNELYIEKDDENENSDRNQ